MSRGLWRWLWCSAGHHRTAPPGSLWSKVVADLSGPVASGVPCAQEDRMSELKPLAVPMPQTSPKAPGDGVRTLAIDIGGTGLKALVLDEQGEPLTERARVETPRPATPDAVLDALVSIVSGLGAFDRI